MPLIRKKKKRGNGEDGNIHPYIMQKYMLKMDTLRRYKKEIERIMEMDGQQAGTQPQGDGGQQGAGDGGQQNQQNDLQQKNEILQRRVSELEKKGEVLDNMLDDEQFQAWVAGQAGGGQQQQQSQQQQQQVQSPDEPSVEELMFKAKQDNPELAAAFERQLKTELEKLQSTLGEEVTNLRTQMTANEKKQQTESAMNKINAMREDQTNWPLFETLFPDMQKLLNDRRVANLEDAYRLAEANKSPEERIEMKRSATMVSGNQGSLDVNITQKLYKSPREAAAAAVGQLGWGATE